MPGLKRPKSGCKKKKLRIVKSLKPSSHPTTSQVKTIVKSEIKANADSKYFRVATIDDLSGGADGSGQDMFQARNNYPQMNVIGYSTGTGARLDGLNTYKYGFQGTASKSIRALSLARLFGADEGNQTLVGNKLEGNTCQPSYSKTEWNIQRLFDQVSTENTGKDVAPYFVRILRLVPRVKKGEYQDIDPENDAFQDQFGRDIGVNNANFNNYDLQLCRPNKRKYYVKQDIVYHMTPSVVFNESAPDYQAHIPVGNNIKCHQMMHDIGSKLYYKDPEGNGYPDDGFKQEFILFHTCHVGIGNTSSNEPNGLRLSCKAVSTFKDL